MSLDTSKPMADAYDPASVEDAWYAWWVKQGYFSAEYKRPGMQLDIEFHAYWIYQA